MKVLVLQARLADDPMMDHERRCFADATGLGPEGLRFVNLPEEVPTIEALSGYDALMVGGAGHFSVVEPDHEFFPAVFGLLRRVVDEGFPTFASCFGFQLFVVALGGRVIHDQDHTEVGGYLVRLTGAGRKDDLFSTLPAEFGAQMGHMDRAVEMPPGIDNLASSEWSPLQALRVPGRPIWASQFHPELDRESNHERYMAYIERYDPAALGDKESSWVSRESREVSELLPRFLKMIGGAHSLRE